MDVPTPPPPTTARAETGIHHQRIRFQQGFGLLQAQQAFVALVRPPRRRRPASARPRRGTRQHQAAGLQAARMLGVEPVAMRVQRRAQGGKNRRPAE